MTGDHARRRPLLWRAHPAAFNTRGRVSGLAITGAVLALLCTLTVRLASSARSAWSAVSASGPAQPDEAIAVLTASLALLITLWLISAVAVSLAAALVDTGTRAGLILGGLSRRIAPVLLRNSVAGLLGVVIAAAPAAADGMPARVATWNARVAAEAIHEPNRDANRAQDNHGQDHGRGLKFSPAWTPAPRPADLVDLRPGWIPDQPEAPRQAPTLTRLTAPVASTGRRSQENGPDEIVIRRSDTLWAIAARHLGPGATDAEIALDWPHWFTANRAVIGADPDRLRPGERLHPPVPARRSGHSGSASYAERPQR
jgi:hypothetical protein